MINELSNIEDYKEAGILYGAIGLCCHCCLEEQVTKW